MGAKTKEVGGGSAAPVANEFNNFLMQQLRGGGGAIMPPGAQSFGPGSPGWNPETAKQVNNAQQPQMQTATGFQNAFNNALNGQVNDQSGANAALQNFFSNPSANNLNLPTFNNQYTSPDFINAQISQLPTNFGAGQTGMADLSGFGNAAQSNFNPMQGFGQVGSSQFTNQFNSALGNMSNPMLASAQQASIAGPQSLGARPELAAGMDWKTAFNMMGEDPLQARIADRARADMRARFGAEGAGALGTGAQFGESNLMAELAAQDASRRRQEALQLMQQDLNERGTGANIALQGRGQDSQYNLGNRNIDANIAQGNAQLGTQASLANASNSLANNANMMQSILGARGQDFSNQAANRGMDISQLGLGNQQSMFNAGQMNDMQQTMIGANLQNQGLGNQFGLSAAGLNNNAMQTNNANNINQSQFQNQFNQNNAQNFANFGQANNALNSQNMTNQQQINNQMFQNMIGQGLNLNQMGNQNTMNMLAQLFGGFGQSNQLGTAQRQIVQQPSALGQIGQGLFSLGSAWLGGGGGNPFGGGNSFGGNSTPSSGWGSQGSGWQRGIPGGTYSGPSWG